MAPAYRLLTGLLLTAPLALGSMPLAAQERAVTQLQTRVWSDQDGIPVNTVVRLRQTPDGYLWVGTESGLARFDGVRFVTLDSPDSPLYTSADIAALEVGAGGELWIGTTSGLIRRRGSETTRWAGEPGLLATAYVEDVYTDTAGRVWVGTTGEGLFLIADDTTARRVPTRGFEPGSIRDVSPSQDGLPWVATDEGLARVGADTVLTLVAGGERIRDTRAVIEDSRGRVWLGTREGLFRFQGDSPVPAMRSGPLSNTLIRSVVEDADGRIWVATSGHGLFRLTGERWERLAPEHGLPSDDLHALEVDARGDLWIGTAGGLALLYEGDVLPITEAEGLSSGVVLPIVEDRRGALWVGTFGGGVTRFGDDGVRVIGVADGLPHDVVLSLAEDAAGRIWIGTRAGLRIFDGTRLVAGPPGALRSAAVVALLAGRDGRMWAGTTEAVFVIDGDDVREISAMHGLSHPWVMSLHEARDGSILVGTQGGGAYRITRTGVEKIDLHEGGSASVVMTFHESSDGALWVGSADGLVRLRDGERALLGRPQGIPDHSTARILSDGRGYLWVGTNRGVYRVAKTQLDSVADGSLAAISPRLFTNRDGMPSTETNGGFHPAGWRGRDGRLFFPTMEGVAVFDPATIAANDAPLRVVIEGLTPAPGAADAPGAVDLPPEVSDVSISYTALDFRHGDQAEFRYRLTDYDTAWVRAGQRRTAYYTHVPPGRYTFAVQARLPGQPWQGAEPLVFRLRPYFYETLWFRVSAVFLALLAILGLHRWRVLVLSRREKELMELVRARERAERRYREIFENAREMVITLDPEGRITEANHEAGRVLGREPRALVGVPLESLAVDEDGEADGGPVRLERIAAEQGLVELAVRRPDGSRVRVETSIRELTEDGGRRGFQLIGRDITDRRLLEDRLRQSQRVEAVGLLAGGVAHDFNNILSVISGYATLLLQGLAKADPLRDDVREISDAADRAAALTHQLLAFSRKQTLRPRVLQLNHVVIGMEKLLRRLIGEDIEFVVDLAPDLWPVTADPGQMEQVITNLAVNARDAMPAGGHLKIQTRNRRVASALTHGQMEVAPGDYVVLTVTDTGAGMTPRVRERIFDPFFTTKRTGHGTGLGLATVLGIVEQSGGAVNVVTTPGHGSIFEIYLPRETAALDPLDEPRPEHDGATGDETILVVDDEESIRRLVRRVLERSGYRVIEAGSGVDALEGPLASFDGQIDLLLTDVVMPQMSGPDLAERIGETHPGLKIIFMSGYTDEKLALRVMTHPLLRKPFGPGELLSKIREVLEG